MTRWQSMTEAVKSFNDKGHAGYAFGTILVILPSFVVPAILGLLVLAR